MLDLRFCARAFYSCGEWGPLFIAVHGPLTVAASLVRSTGSRYAGSAVVAHGPSCSAACGIFPDQGSNPCPVHWQADSQPLRHQGSPPFSLIVVLISAIPLGWYCFWLTTFAKGVGVTVSGTLTWLLLALCILLCKSMVKCKSFDCAKNIYSNYTFSTGKITTRWICGLTR